MVYPPADIVSPDTASSAATSTDSVAEDTRYKHDDYGVRSNDPYAQTKYQIVMNWLPRTPNLHVLNAGCGSGEMTVLLAKNTTWQIDAIDVDEEAIQLSHRLKQELSLTNVNVYKTSIEDHQAQPYDIIISNDVLEHIADDIAAMKALSGLLKPAGTLAVSVPALQWLFGYHDEMLGHYRRYNKSLLVKRLSQFFTVKQCRYFGGTLIPIALAYSRLLRKAYPVGKQRQGSIAGTVLNTMLKMEKSVVAPLGTSLLAMAVSKR